MTEQQRIEAAREIDAYYNGLEQEAIQGTQVSSPTRMATVNAIIAKHDQTQGGYAHSDPHRGPFDLATDIYDNWWITDNEGNYFLEAKNQAEARAMLAVLSNPTKHTSQINIKELAEYASTRKISLGIIRGLLKNKQTLRVLLDRNKGHMTYGRAESEIIKNIQLLLRDYLGSRLQSIIGIKRIVGDVPKVQSRYDADAKVLYISINEPECSISSEVEPNVLIRRHPDTNCITGFTLLNFAQESESEQ